MKHIGRVLISEKLLLSWLHYEGGHLIAAGTGCEGRLLEVIIEHPDMPSHHESDDIPIVTPVFTTKPEMYERTGARIETI